MKTVLLLVILILQVFALYYLIRTAHNLGSKSTKNHNEVMANLRQIRATSGGTLLNHLFVPDSKEFKSISWEHVISLTSHPARFNTLAKSLNSLLEQRLIPKKIYLNIAEQDMTKLPEEVKRLSNTGVLIINSCSDLGPG